MRTFALTLLLSGCVTTAPLPTPPQKAPAQTVATCGFKTQSITLAVPEGWSADYDSAKAYGACVFIYPSAYTFDTAPVVFYPNFSSAAECPAAEAPGSIDLASFIADDLSPFVERNPHMIVDHPTLLTASNGRTFTVVNIRNGPPPNEFERVAYLPLKGEVLIAVLSARSEAALSDYAASFASIIASIKTPP